MTSPETNVRMERYERELERMTRALAQQIADGARRRVYRNLKSPKARSPLADSIRVTADSAGGWRVVTDKYYARFVEFGTRYQPARPFLTPAAEEVKVNFSLEDL